MSKPTKYISTGRYVLYTLEAFADLGADYKTIDSFFDGRNLYRIINHKPDENGFIECKEFAPYYQHLEIFFENNED
jgi:hypothetical protein